MLYQQVKDQSNFRMESPGKFQGLRVGPRRAEDRWARMQGREHSAQLIGFLTCTGTQTLSTGNIHCDQPFLYLILPDSQLAHFTDKETEDQLESAVPDITASGTDVMRTQVY